MSNECKCKKCCAAEEITIKIDKDYCEAMFGGIDGMQDQIDNAIAKENKIEIEIERRIIVASLDRAHEIRKFELDLYWKRALYFWGIIVVQVTAFGFLFNEEGDNSGVKLAALLISYLGFFTSIAWRYHEEGSKAYPRNWEYHIDFLEEYITGNLHKTLFGDENDYYSVSKINSTIISLIAISWFTASFFVSYYLKNCFSDKCFCHSVWLYNSIALFIIWSLTRYFANNDSISCLPDWRTGLPPAWKKNIGKNEEEIEFKNDTKAKTFKMFSRTALKKKEKG